MLANTRRSAVAAAAFLVFAGAVGSLEASTVIDFGTAPYSIGTVITNQYAADGVVFSLESIIDPSFPGPVIDSFPAAGTQGLYNTFNGNIALQAEFTGPVTEVSFTSIVDTPLHVWAFDSGGNLLGEATIPGGAAVGQILTTTNIARLRFLNDSGTGHMGRSDLTILQTLSFGGGEAAVPEPATLASGLTALLAGAGLAWRRRTAS